MSLGLILVTLICINFTRQVSTGDTYRCPSEAKMAIGFKWGSQCVTFMLLQPMRVHETPNEFLNKLCEATFYGGRRYGFMNQDRIDRSKWWFDTKVIRKTWPHGNRIWPIGHFIFKIVAKNDCSWYWPRMTWSCSIEIDAHVEGGGFRYVYRYYDWPADGYSRIDDGWLLAKYHPDDYVKWFLRQKGIWLCPVCTLNQNGDYADYKLHHCSEVMTWSDYHVACLHNAYRNCNYKMVEHCHFDEDDQKWYKYTVSILSEARSPYGIPCPTGIPKQWKRQCEKTCRGNWGKWSAEPSEEHLRCDTITRERFAPAESGAAPCNKSGLTCCMAKKVTKYNDSCTDFASNTTINLKKQGCNNNGTISRDSYGHLKCVCPDRYIGIQCEEDVCEGTCLNGGTCVPARGKPHCFCRRGFTGSNCSEALKSCGESGTCQNGGTCETLFIGAEEVKVCKCKDGYGGVTCEREVQKCEDDSCNYNGVCRENAEYGMIECTCYQSYEGEYCDKKDGKLIERLINPTSSNVVNVVVGFVLGFLMLMLCFGGAAVHHRRRRRRGGHSYESSYASTFSTAISSRASTFSTAISRAFGRKQTVKAKKADTRSLAKGSSKAVGVSKVG
ncbi:hypothetical protein TTRE_0000827601 [Trichuris trichiura]|uniref:EGF-like domain-containing protein n=1 Tax=Trichuris trichiura TaxID=36087 RepID=A0A077ZJL7_TRITR|nr:hypothetical protein TTRE_0000827601 [Trichuris trichiura]